MLGESDTRFEPMMPLTRGMFVTIIGRMEESEKNINLSGSNVFTDIDESKYYAPYIAWAEDNNIVLGFGDGTYRPDEIITREQAAVITKRYMQYKGKTISEAELSYSDKNLISDWALNGVKCCAASRIMIGHTDNTFALQNQIIRAEFAAVINRLRK